MPIFRGLGGSAEGTSNAYAGKVAQDAVNAKLASDSASAAMGVALQASTDASTALTALNGIQDNIESLVIDITKSFFQQSTPPSVLNLTEGDLWYNTDTTEFMVYRKVDGMLQWTHLILDNTSGSSDITDAGSF